MEVLFVTREPDVCRLLAARIADGTVGCTVQDDFLRFYLLLQDEQVHCDMLVLDFRQFQHLLCNVSSIFQKLKQPLPFVFYNDPYPDGTNRAMYWLQQNESLYGSQEFHHLMPLFTALNAAIEDPSIRPHISLLQPPLPVTSQSTSVSISEDIDLTQFQIHTKMPPALFNLFAFFYQNRCKEVSVKDIARQLFGTGFYTGLKRNAVYSYVSRLKKYIKSDAGVHFDIIRSSQERYKMVTTV